MKTTKETENARRLTGLLLASIKLEQAKDHLEFLRQIVRDQEKRVQELRDEEYKYRLLQ